MPRKEFPVLPQSPGRGCAVCALPNSEGSTHTAVCTLPSV